MIVVREVVSVPPKRIWPHNTFSQVTAGSVEELFEFAKKMNLDFKSFVDMKFHPHFKLESISYNKAINLGASILNKQQYDLFVSQNHS